MFNLFRPLTSDDLTAQLDAVATKATAVADRNERRRENIEGVIAGLSDKHAAATREARRASDIRARVQRLLAD